MGGEIASIPAAPGFLIHYGWRETPPPMRRNGEYSRF